MHIRPYRQRIASACVHDLQLSYFYISRGSVATCSGWGEILSDRFIANFPQNVPVKEIKTSQCLLEDIILKSMVSPFSTHSAENTRKLSYCKDDRMMRHIL